MIIEQAVFGEFRGGHALRAASSGAVMAADLAPRLDLPDTAPPGVDWSPYVSGFPFRDRYVIARTFRDAGATRAGMVLSHALIVPIEEIITISDLRPVFALLISDPHPPTSVTSIEIEVADSDQPQSIPELRLAAAALVSREPGPAVRIGYREFDEVVLSLWVRLWPAIRRNFSFRLSFGPSDIVEEPAPTIVCTPSSLVARWQGRRMLGSSAPDPGSLAIAMLSGDDAGKPLRDFAERFDVEITSFSELPLLEHAYRLSTLEPDTSSNALAALRLIDRLSPDPIRGQGGKRDLLNRLVLHLESASADDVLALRNLCPRGFNDIGRVWRALETWVAENEFSAVQDSRYIAVVSDAVHGEGVQEGWREAITQGLAAAINGRGPGFSSAFWRWAEAMPELIRPLWSVIKTNPSVENSLVRVVPGKLGLASASALLEIAKNDKLYRLHGAVASAAYEPLKSVRLQLEVDTSSVVEGIQLALRNASPSELVKCALEVADSRVVQMAADAVAQRPALLKDADMRSETARKLWEESLSRSIEVWRGPAHPYAAVEVVLLDMLESGSDSSSLLSWLASTPLADISNFGRRAEVWPKVSEPARGRMIQATASGWIDKVDAGAAVIMPERELQSSLLVDAKLDDVLDRLASGRVGVGVQVIGALSGFAEYRFRAFLSKAVARTRPLSVADAEAVGHLILGRRWRSVVSDMLLWLKSGRDDIRPALRVCESLLSWLERWANDISAISPAEKWESLEEVMAGLYPRGPDQDGIWERSGGHDADLVQGGSGRERWRTVLEKIRRGGKGPRIADLLREMQNDYPGNESLRFLANAPEFRNWK